MDDSKPDVTLEAAAQPSAHRWIVARAIASAAVFGYIGKRLGQWLGHYGNDVENKMAEPIMKWSMASFWAVMGAYASLKASEIQPAATDVPATGATAEKIAAVPEPKEKRPLSLIEVDTLKDHGRLQAEPLLQRS